MRACILSLLLFAATLGCDGGRAVDPCADPAIVRPSEAAPELDAIPGDSVVSALLEWPVGAVPRGVGDELRARGWEVVHEFHYLPAILVAATGDQLRAFAEANPSVRVSFGATTKVLQECR